MSYEYRQEIQYVHVDIIDDYFYDNKISKENKKDKEKLQNWIKGMYGYNDTCNDINISNENLEGILEIVKKYDLPEILFLKHMEEGKEAVKKHEFLYFEGRKLFNNLFIKHRENKRIKLEKYKYE